MIYKKFIKEGNDVISKMQSVNENGIFTDLINKLSTILKSIEEDSDNLEYYPFMDMVGDISNYSVGNVSEFKTILSILLCASYINRYGVITYPNCTNMESFTKDDLQKLADILGSQITFDTNEFIVVMLT